MVEALHKGVIVDDHQDQTYTLVEICVICGVGEIQVIDLVAFGIVDPIGRSAGDWRFSESSLYRTKKALRLRRDLDLDHQGLALALDLLDEIDRLRSTLAAIHKDS